ncbi:hypothetical protein QBC47DRAFT_293539 [Echria macrotheca]|uniref:Uncharacterized protein n=1 Tax=Echria macrotheca TaxID=438768 RepID=A0AAJ0BJU6_9PEZI|nr:hypothetical protein QBC47DRAFT_293539 [Echria macrotheca]
MADNSTDTDSWFPVGKQDLGGWRFDVITLLAVIGESSVAVHAQTLTASTLCLLPRIIPAPQALLRPVRPQRLPEVTAKMAGVYGGIVLDSVGFFANIMHPLEELKPYAFRVLEIKHRDLNDVAGLGRVVRKPGGDRMGHGWTSSVDGMRNFFQRGRANGSGAGGAGAGAGRIGGGISMGLHRRSPGNNRVTFEERGENVQMDTINPAEGQSNGAVGDDQQQRQQPPAPEPLRLRMRRQSNLADFLVNPTMVNKQERYAVPPAPYSPLHIVSVLSCLLTIAIFVCAAIWKDGTAMTAIAAISIASTVTCYASYWRPLLMHRPATSKVPPGDVVIRTREGAFVLIRCREEVARELYSGTEECQYVSTKYHRVFMGLGMVLLMVAVVLLGNCGWYSQVMIGMSYILLNALYWIIGLVPAKYFWDLSRYTMVDITPDDARDAHLVTSDDPREGAPSFTRTLWYAIRETRHKAWAERSSAMPGTEQWKKWLAEAVENAWQNKRDWPAVTRKNEIMKENLEATSPVMGSAVVDYGAAAGAAADGAGTGTGTGTATPNTTTGTGTGAAATPPTASGGAGPGATAAGAVPGSSSRASSVVRTPDTAEQVAPLDPVQPRFLHERTGTF